MRSVAPIIDRLTDDLADLLALRQRYCDAAIYYRAEITSIENKIDSLNHKLDILQQVED
jgi:hypothetical protein